MISNFHDEVHSKVKRGLNDSLENVFKIQGRGIGGDGEMGRRADERLHVAEPFFILFGAILAGFALYALYGKAKKYWARRKKDTLFASLVEENQNSYMGV